MMDLCLWFGSQSATTDLLLFSASFGPGNLQQRIIQVSGDDLINLGQKQSVLSHYALQRILFPRTNLPGVHLGLRQGVLVTLDLPPLKFHPMLFSVIFSFLN